MAELPEMLPEMSEKAAEVLRGTHHGDTVVVVHSFNGAPKVLIQCGAQTLSLQPHEDGWRLRMEKRSPEFAGATLWLRACTAEDAAGQLVGLIAAFVVRP